MSLGDICDVQISATTNTPTRVGFGTPLIMAGKVPFVTGVVGTYSSLKEYTDAGGAVTDPAYLALTAVFSQKPRPKFAKVGKRSSPAVQTITLKCLSAVEGDVYTITIGLSGRNLTVLTYTVLASATTTTVATAIELLIEAVTGIASTSSTDTITVTCETATNLMDMQSWSANFKLTDITADPGIVADITAVVAADNNWYGLVLDSNSRLEIKAAAAYIEANVKLFPWNTSDSACFDPASTTDVLYETKVLDYARSGGLFVGTKLLNYGAGAWLGRCLPKDPGSYTFAYKTLVGVPADLLTQAKHNAIINKNGNTYETIAGLNVTFEGTSSAHEYFDVPIFIDWLSATMQNRVFGALANAEKIPFTDPGISIIESIVSGTLEDGISVGGLAADPAPIVTVPKAADVSTDDKGERNLPNVTFSGELAGAIHKVKITGSLSL